MYMNFLNKFKSTMMTYRLYCTWLNFPSASGFILSPFQFQQKQKQYLRKPEVIISCSEFVHRSKCFFDVSHKSSERYLSTTVCSSEALSCEFKQLQLTSAGSGNAVKLAELAEEPASGRENYNCQRVVAPDEHLKTDRIMTASDCVSSERWKND